MKLKDNWSLLTIKDFAQISEIQETETEILERDILILSVLTGESVEIIEALPLTELKSLVKRLSFLQEQIPDKVINKVRIGGRTFIAQPDITKIKAYEYIDLMNAKDNVTHFLHVFAAIFFKEYSWFKKKLGYQERAELFKEHMTITTAYPVCVFFCNLLIGLTPIIGDYLADRAKEVTVQLNSFTNAGPGKLTSTN